MPDKAVNLCSKMSFTMMKVFSFCYYITEGFDDKNRNDRCKCIVTGITLEKGDYGGKAPGTDFCTVSTDFNNLSVNILLRKLMDSYVSSKLHAFNQA